MNINLELFKRYKPENKVAIIEKLTDSEVLATRESTILRIIKETGRGDSRKARSKFKTLSLNHRVGNSWNSTVESIYNWKKDEIFMSVYIQGDDTDTNVEVSIKKLLNSSDTEIEFGSFEESYLHSSSRLIHARYDRVDRAKVVREILNSYVHSKYNV